MAKTRAPRPEKRHLVRWTEPMDKKLLLTIQSECNKANITLPWAEIGTTMGPKISGGAVIQHLAKLRIRMVAQGLPVPEPLKRGGGTRIPTGPSISRARASVSGPSSARFATTKKSASVLAKRRHKAHASSDGSTEDGSGSDSDAEYGQPTSKRAKTETKNRLSRDKKYKITDSDDDNEQGSSSDVVKHELESDGEPVVAAGAPFLALEDDVSTQGQLCKKAPAEVQPSLIVTLKLPTNGHTSVHEDRSDDPSENEDSDEESEDGDEDEGDFKHESGPTINETNTKSMYHGTSASTYNDSSTSGVRTFGARTGYPHAFKYFSDAVTGDPPQGLGGLTSINNFNDDSNLLMGFDDSAGADVYGMNVESGPFNAMMHQNGADVGYGQEQHSFGEQTFHPGNFNMLNRPTFLTSSNIDLNGHLDPGVSGYSRSYVPQLSTAFSTANVNAQVNQSTGANSISSTAVNQTPVTKDSDCNMSGLPVDHSSFGDITNDDWTGSHFDAAYVHEDVDDTYLV